MQPGTKILLWLGLVALSQSLTLTTLIGAAVVLGAAAVSIAGARFVSLLLRIKYVLLALVLIYALATPGVALIPAWGRLAPTQAGLLAGGSQALRLCAALAGLSVVLATTTRDQLLSGIVWIARPLRIVGVDVERFAVRLALTLTYAEQTVKLRFRELLDELRSSGDHGESEATITIPSHRLRALDWLVLAAALTLMLLVLT